MKNHSHLLQKGETLCLLRRWGKAPCSAAPYRAKWPLFPNVPTPPLPRRFWARGWSSSQRGASSCELFAPADARVEFALSTKHALGLGTAEGVKFLIHVGMDTNKLEGDGFQSFAKMGDEVKRGDKLLSFDPQVMAENRCSLATPFVFCNSMEILRTGRVEAGEDLIRLTPKET